MALSIRDFANNATGGGFGKAALDKARAAGMSDNEIRRQLAAGVVNSVGERAAESLGLGKKDIKAGEFSSHSLLNSLNRAAEPAPSEFEVRYPVNMSEVTAGLSPEFAATLNLPSGTTSLSEFGATSLRDNVNNSWKLYQEEKLTNLRGQISKELSQLYNATEIDKLKLSSKAAIDAQRKAGEDNFRTAMKQSYSQILASMG